MTNVRELTAGYVAAFNARDLHAVGDFFSENFELTDPDVTRLTPKADVLLYIKSLFDTHKDLNFAAHNIVVDGKTSVIHFTLTLGTLVLDGVDFITWNSGQMVSMQAYLTPRS